MAFSIYAQETRMITHLKKSGIPYKSAAIERGVAECAGVTNLSVTFSSDCAEAILKWTSPAASRRGIVFSEDFEGEDIDWSGENNGDGADWAIYGGSDEIPAHSGKSMAGNEWKEHEARDAWLFSPPISLTAGTKYTIKFWLLLPGYTEEGLDEYDHFELKIGQEGVSLLDFTLLYKNTNTHITNWTEISKEFTPSESGEYYLGFHAFTPENEGFYILIDDVEVSTSGGGGDEPSLPCNIYFDGELVASNVTTIPYIYKDLGGDDLPHTYMVKVACDGGGESDPASVTKKCDEVGIVNQEINHIRISPNPTTGKLNVQSSRFKVQSVEIYDVLGRKVYDDSHSYGLTVLRSCDLTPFPAGVYFIKITTEEGIVTKRIIKQ